MEQPRELSLMEEAKNMSKTKKLIWAGLITAMIVLATAVIKFPTGIGYINAGDAIVLLSAFILGPFWGALAAGLGSALADVMAGYATYAPGTFLIKALMALVAGLILCRVKGVKLPLRSVIGAVVAEIIMVAGYFVYESLFLGFGWGAIAAVPANAIQAVFGATAGCALYLALAKIPYVRDNYSIGDKK